VGKNKLSKFAEMACFENVFQPSFDELMAEGFRLKGIWATHHFGNTAPVIVELGCGKGEYSVHLAEKFPDKNFIGVDIKGARIYTGARYAIEKGVKNVAFIRSRIENTGFLFGEDEIDEIWLPFPDPQQKNVSKRLTSTFYLKRYLNFLRPGGIIHVKTDSVFQFAYTSALVQLNHFGIIAQTGDLYSSDQINDVTGIQTFYEKQWLHRGIAIKYISFVPRRSENLLEPDQVFEKDTYRSFGRSARNLQKI
jgi:tRNA (guanine-N7-)-methyltransferase